MAIALFVQYAPLLLVLWQGSTVHGRQRNPSEHVALFGPEDMVTSLGSFLADNVNKSTIEGLESSCKHIACNQNGLEERHHFPAQIDRLPSIPQIVLQDESLFLHSDNKPGLASHLQKQHSHKRSRKLLEASGPFRAEEWMDGQDRKQIVSSHYPFSAIGQFDNGCTGTLIGPCHVLTAGHCIYDPKKHEWSNKLGFTPGRTGGGAWEPHGRAEARSKNVMLGWQLFSDFAADLGVVVLDRRLGDVTGTMGFGNGMQGETLGLNMAGYPNDKSPGEMWYDYCEGAKHDQSANNVIYHSCTPDNGNSGSPLWVYGQSDSLREIRGVHTGVVSHLSVMLSASGQAGNKEHPFGVMITHQESSILRRWISENQC